MTRRAAAVNMACYMDTENEEEGSVNVVRCEMLVFNMLKAEEEEAPKCLTDKDKFLEWQELERRRKIAEGEYVA